MRRRSHDVPNNLRAAALIGLLGLFMLSLSGCVSSGKYEAMVQERDNVQAEKTAVEAEKLQLEAEKARISAEKQELMEEKAKIEMTLAEIARQKEMADQEAAAAQAELDRQQQVYESLQNTFAKEQEANQVKIEMMKSGVKVNLANEILFPSGSAELNATGIEVLTRAAGQLRESPYQTVVAGFTDDVAISGSLKEKYPTNWELAGARAASVVRLLEQEGVPSEQLLAISFGANSPVAPNETPEGRSKNRRIEIVLRPVSVSMN